MPMLCTAQLARAPAQCRHGTCAHARVERTNAKRRTHSGCKRAIRAHAAASPLPVVILPGLGNNAADYDRLKDALRARSEGGESAVVTVADVKRYDWLRNAAGLTDVNYWRGTLCPRPTVDWYLNYIDDAVEQSLLASGADEVVLLAHSAGGWLGRVWMHASHENATRVRKFCSLGSPHRPPPTDGDSLVIDQTRGILTWVEREMPGAHHDDVEYVTVAGTYLEGLAPSVEKVTSGTSELAQVMAGVGYMQVCGKADVPGDGITPVETAHLPGERVKRVTVEGAYHTPLGADGESRKWYGDEPHLSAWIDEVLI